MSGIFGVSCRADCMEDLFCGTDYHSHLGTQFAGLAVWNGVLSRKIHDIRGSQFKTKFFADYKTFKGTKGIGVISAQDEQPVHVSSKFGSLAIVTNGFIDNADALTKRLYGKGYSFTEFTSGRVNLTELAAKLILQGKTLVDGIERMFSEIEGSCSLLILDKDGIYAARDRLGYTPLVIGQRGADWAVTTETSAFSNLGFKVKKYLLPGEIVFIGKHGLQTKRKGNTANQICSFLWIYTGFPASSYEGISVEVVRERCGRALAKNDGIDIDFVSGIPDSGTTHAIGYAIESKAPFRRALVKYTPGFDRSYTPPSQEMRDRIAKMKLLPIRDIAKGRSIAVCDDSIVRGTQLKNFTVQKLWECGAREIHLRIACPPLMFPCKFNYSTRSVTELVARRAIAALEKRAVKDPGRYLDETSGEYAQMVDWITRDIGVTSLKYQRLHDMIKAIGLPEDQLCLYCWTGREPKNGCCSSRKRKA